MQRKKAPPPNSATAMDPKEFPVLRSREVARRREHYDGAELRPNPGLPPGRLRAYRLPSRMGDKLHYPDGRVEPAP